MKSRRRGTPTSGISPPAGSRASISPERTASSTGGGGASTSRAPSASGKAPPLTYEDVEPLLARADLSEETVLVGGQALNFWTEYYADRIPEVRALGPLTSRDIDFVGREDAARACAARLDGRVHFADLDHATANYAVVHFVDSSGHERVIDFLEQICGVESEDLKRTALRVEALDPKLKRAGLHITIMQPVVCMESRLSNSVEYSKYRTDHGLLQARMSILCAKAFLLDLLDQGNVKAVEKLNERIFRFATGKTGRAAASRFHLDPFAAVLVADRLPEAFRTVRYPQMQRLLERRRGRPGHDLGR